MKKPIVSALIACLVMLCLSIALPGCSISTSSREAQKTVDAEAQKVIDAADKAQAALDSANAHMTKEAGFYEQEAKQEAAWQAAYLMSVGPPNFGKGTAESASYLGEVEKAIASRLDELAAAKVDLNSIAGMNVDPVFTDLARLYIEVVDSEVAYCNKDSEYIAVAKELSAAGFPQDQAKLSALDALRVELDALADTVNTKYDAVSSYADEHAD
jgi:hypothetical protein